METFSKYSFYLKDLHLNRSSLTEKTGPGFEPETEHLIGCFSDLQASGGFSIYNTENLSFKLGTRISKIVRNAQKTAIFAVTLGKGYKEISERYTGDPLLYYLTDIIASEYTEAAADYIHNKISEVALNYSLKYSNRYSPGYCGWNTDEQKRLFSYLPPSPCGIHLTSSSLMDPVKSISGIVALGKDVKYIIHDCNRCSDDNCLYRKKFIL